MSNPEKTLLRCPQHLLGTKARRSCSFISSLFHVWSTQAVIYPPNNLQTNILKAEETFTSFRV